MKRLAILSTHPIQYNAPLFRILHEDPAIELKVFFSKTLDQVKFDPDFQREVTWDIPVNVGYEHETYDASRRNGRKSLSKAIRAFNPHAILIYGWSFPGHLQIMRSFHQKIPIWFRGDSHLLDAQPFWKTIVRRIWLSWVYTNIDLAFTVGSANDDYFRWCGLKTHQLVRAAHAIDNEYFQNQNLQRHQEAAKLRAQLGIEPVNRIVLFVGKLEKKKNPKILIKVLNQLDENYHLVFVGTGPLHNQLEAQCARLRRAHFLGFKNQSEMPIIYRMADVFCLPSEGPNETWGLSVNEAIASGTPSIASHQAGCSKDIFIDPSLGRAISPNNIDALKAAIIAHANTKPSPSALELFSSTFSYHAFVTQIQIQCQMTNH